jgi:hypothetical protein
LGTEELEECRARDLFDVAVPSRSFNSNFLGSIEKCQQMIDANGLVARFPVQSPEKFNIRSAMML